MDFYCTVTITSDRYCNRYGCGLYGTETKRNCLCHTFVTMAKSFFFPCLKMPHFLKIEKKIEKKTQIRRKMNGKFQLPEQFNSAADTVDHVT